MAAAYCAVCQQQPRFRFPVFTVSTNSLHVRCQTIDDTLNMRRAANEDACLAQCAAEDDCNCALYKGGTCTQLWTTCDSTVLNLRPNKSGSVALKPCAKFPLTFKNATASSKSAIHQVSVSNLYMHLRTAQLRSSPLRSRHRCNRWHPGGTPVSSCEWCGHCGTPLS